MIGAAKLAGIGKAALPYIGGAVALAVLTLGAYWYGRAAERAHIAEAQAQAVSDAHDEARDRWQGALDQQRERSEAHRARVRALEQDLADAREAVTEYDESEDAARECFGPEATAIWDAL